VKLDERNPYARAFNSPREKTFFTLNASKSKRRSARTTNQAHVRGQAMKNILWTIGGFCAAATGFLVWRCKRNPPVELLAHRLEQAWADHHTVAETT